MSALARDGSDAYPQDIALLKSLGLPVTGFGFERTELGTVTLHEATERYGKPVPATTVKVEVTAMPAQFWNFTITRSRDESRELGNNEWEPVYEPVEVLEVRTGSGHLGDYWPAVKAIAGHFLSVEKIE